MFHSSINKRVMSQITNSILMIKPTGFTYNAETAENNHFQNPISTQNQKEISENALREFDNMVYKLDSKGVNVTVIDPKENYLNPDAVFPNNWFSLHKDGTKILYPMFAKSRRKERDLEIFKILEKNLNFKIKTTVDFTIYEQENLYLEGTGSMILDRDHKKIFVPDCYDTYVMDGSHAHSLDPGTEEKITLCIGAPWKGKPNAKYDEILNNSLFNFKVSRPSYYKQEWLDPFFKK